MKTAVTFYRDACTAAGIRLFTPDDRDQTLVHEKYLAEVTKGIFLPQTRGELLRIVDRLHDDHAVEGIILGRNGAAAALIRCRPQRNSVARHDGDSHERRRRRNALAGTYAADRAARPRSAPTTAPVMMNPMRP